MIPTPLPEESPLALHIDPRVSAPGDFATAIPGLSLFRRDQPAPPVVCMIEPSLILVGRGEKRLWVGGEGYSYDPSRFLVTSLDLPANSEVMLASPERPCVGLVLKLDVSMLAEVITKSGLPAKRQPATGTGAAIGSLSSALEGALDRLLALLDEPEAIPVLAPLILREIHYRLLHRSRRTAAADHGRRWPGLPHCQGHRLAQGQLHRCPTHRRSGRAGADERADLSPSFPPAHRHESVAVPEMAAAERGPPADAGRAPRRFAGGVCGWL